MMTRTHEAVLHLIASISGSSKPPFNSQRYRNVSGAFDKYPGKERSEGWVKSSDGMHPGPPPDFFALIVTVFTGTGSVSQAFRPRALRFFFRVSEIPPDPLLFLSYWIVGLDGPHGTQRAAYIESTSSRRQM